MILYDFKDVTLMEFLTARWHEKEEEHQSNTVLIYTVSKNLKCILLSGTWPMTQCAYTYFLCFVRDHGTVDIVYLYGNPSQA